MDATLVPVMMDEEPDPDELLKIRCCNCRVTLKNPCCGNSALATPMALRPLVLAEVLMKKWCKIGKLVDRQGDIKGRFHNSIFDNIFSV